jgi:hypothetical protein
VTRPNDRLVHLGRTLIDHYALAAEQAYEHLARQRALCDGYPARGETAGRGTATSSSTEGAIVSAEHFDEQTARLRHAINAVDTATATLGHVIGDVLPPTTVQTKRCADGQVGKDSGLWSDNVHCPELPTKKGMCAQHYMRYYRYRVAHLLPVDQDFEPIA